MINAYYGVKETPFNLKTPTLLEQQQRAFDVILSQCRCTDSPSSSASPAPVRSSNKPANTTKTTAVPIVSRTLHTYHSILRIL